ncbi:Eco57I restriction-modification methylase domain-containing protein [Desulfosoma sp.]
MKTFSAVRIEGGLFSPDLMDQLLAEELPGQKPRDFGLDGRRHLNDEIAAAFADGQALWHVFQRRLERLSESDLGTTVTRDAWVVPFLGLLGYELPYNRRAYVVDGLSFAVSHRVGEPEDGPPVHIVGVKQELGRLAPSGRPRLAPHSLVQEFLNRTEALWGLVTNGKVLRLLRDSTYIRRQCYLEFDLEAIFEQHLFQDFAVLYRLLHRSRLPRTGADAHQCLLEHYHQRSIEQGGRVRDLLRDGVEQCLKVLANGFLAHPKNDDLRRRTQAAPRDPERLGPEELYRQLLRVVYRFLFLFVSEDRGLISQNALYLDHYGVSRLRRHVDHRSAYTGHDDLWLSLRVLWKLFSDDQPVQQIGGKPLATLLDLPVLNGQLFEPLFLDACRITNRDLLQALWCLVNYQENSSSAPRRVNYAALDVEDLGSVYESLLDYQPRIDASGTLPRFELVFGSERKSTGSYYTPAELVGELIRSALEPVIEERLKGAKTADEKERALLSIKVVDPACGSGHFLLAAARRLGKDLARIRSREEEPAPERVREAIRDVVAHCIYGVDKNPLAVDLCRVALWIEAHTPGKPLTFLDHRIRCGDSLVGVFDLDVLKQGVPDEAFNPVSGDDKRVASVLKRKNSEQRRGQRSSLRAYDAAAQIGNLSTEALALDRIADDSPEAIRRKQQLYQALQQKMERDRTACDLWTAAFFQPRNEGTPREAIIITERLRSYMESGTAHPQTLAHAKALAYDNRFFHWPLEFPEVFVNGGFDVVLGNPPWERIKLQEQEFFASRDPAIASAPNTAARRRLIQELPRTNGELWNAYHMALHVAESSSRFLRGSGQYPFTGRGDINTYSVFAERMRALLKPGGRAGVIVPTGIATDATNQYFFADLVEKSTLASLFDFENREKIFPAVDSRYKFCLLTLMGSTDSERPLSRSSTTFAFFATRAEHLRDPRRVFSLSAEDLVRINPNTRTLPVFRTRHDAELTKAIYKRVPVLVNERAAGSGEAKTGKRKTGPVAADSPVRSSNPWGARFMAMFHMSNDSHLFRTRTELEQKGYRLVGNRFVKGREVYLPLYEAKMMWHYDHRFGTYAGVESRSSTHLPTPDEAHHADPGFLAQPWYWVPAEEVKARLGGWKHGWLLGFRDVARSTDERTAIFTLLPRVGVGNNLPILLFSGETKLLATCLLGNVNAQVFDHVTRQKIAGVHMNFFLVTQLPVLPPDAYTPKDLRFIVPRVLELTYTAWDMKPFGDDVWNEADDGLRQAIRRQWQENAQQADGHKWSLPDWIEAYPEIETDPAKGIPFPPFRWNESRRALVRAELDVCYARLYGLTRKQLRYILDPADLTDGELENILDPHEDVTDPLHPEGYAGRAETSDFPGETFRVLKEKEIRQYGEYRTRRLVLEVWEVWERQP